MTVEDFHLETMPVIDETKVPKHVAIIMDGNRRWAVRNKKKTIQGHLQGAEKLNEMVRIASDIGIQYLTVYSFSTENWTRSKSEVDGLMELFQFYLKTRKQNMIQEGVCLQAIGDLEGLPKEVFSTLKEVEEATSGGSKITLILALNYGARNEMVRGVKKVLQDYSENKIAIDDIDESLISKYLDTKGICDPELLIRTSGEFRISNFLLWQLSYAEFFVTETLWPDFSESELRYAIQEFQKRNRRGGS